MITNDEISKVGVYNKPHGVEGEISATFVCDIDDLEHFSTLISCIDGINVPFFIEKYRQKNDHTILVKLEGIDSEADVKMFVNKPIYVLKHEMVEADDEVYCDFFIGFDIVAADGSLIGHIEDVDDSTENALFVVQKGEDEFLIPIAEEFILEVDEENSRLVMDLPEGIIASQF